MFFLNTNQLMAPLVSLHVFSEKETIVDDHESGIRKAINTQDITTLLNFNFDSKPVKIEPGTLAIRLLKSCTEEKILFHMAPQIKTLHLEQPQATSFDFFFRDMLFFVYRDLTSGEFHRNVEMFTWNPETDTVYVPPLYNLSNNGDMCFNQIDVSKCLTIIDFLEVAVFRSIWTHTTWIPPKVMKQGTLFQYLYGHKESGWNFNDLKPLTSLEKLIKEM